VRIFLYLTDRHQPVGVRLRYRAHPLQLLSLNSATHTSRRQRRYFPHQLAADNLLAALYSHPGCWNLRGINVARYYSITARKRHHMSRSGFQPGRRPLPALPLLRAGTVSACPPIPFVGGQKGELTPSQHHDSNG